MEEPNRPMDVWLMNIEVGSSHTTTRGGRQGLMTGGIDRASQVGGHRAKQKVMGGPTIPTTPRMMSSGMMRYMGKMINGMRAGGGAINHLMVVLHGRIEKKQLGPCRLKNYYQTLCKAGISSRMQLLGPMRKML